MAKRFIIGEDAFLVVEGRKVFFQANRRQPDGSPGYTLDELKGLSRDQRRRFREVTVDGFGVEQATAAPGEKRSVRRSREETTESEVGEAVSE